ncbi:DUF3854 domain-containing protein [bacterium]|nr:DUF3854 domain-containing protein [bacterium]
MGKLPYFSSENERDFWLHLLSGSTQNSQISMPTPIPEIQHLSDSVLSEFVSELHSQAIMVKGLWDRVERNPSIELTITEGGKKSLSLLSQGYVAIALYGVNSGYNRVGNVRELIPDVARFIQPGQKITLAFDQDEKGTTRKRVSVALHRFGILLKQSGAEVLIASWDGKQGKGIDDVLVHAGLGAVARALNEALLFLHWQIWQWLESQLTYAANLRLETRDLSTVQLADVPTEGILAIASAKGTGKPNTSADWLPILQQYWRQGIGLR